jgi:beta-glucosidase
VIGGGGSGFVNPAYVSAPFDALGARLDVTYGDETDMDAAGQVAAAADVAIVFVGASSTEGQDRDSLSLPEEHDQLISAVASTQKNVVVVVATPGPILTPWRDDVAAILVPWMPGQEFGEAIADVLLGDVNPAARLHHTMPNIENEIQMTDSQWPGINLTATYTEKLEVGYRWYSSHEVVPAFPFGHGLSYTTFSYGDLRIGDDSVAFNLTNTGQRAGAEVAQMYLTFPESAGEPPKQLKGFAKVLLQPGESKEVKLPTTARDFSIWDVETHGWQEVSGEFSVEVGASIMDTRATGSIKRGGMSMLV